MSLEILPNILLAERAHSLLAAWAVADTLSKAALDHLIVYILVCMRLWRCWSAFIDQVRTHIALSQPTGGIFRAKSFIIHLFRATRQMNIQSLRF
jgi:hypothetical protein